MKTNSQLLTTKPKKTKQQQQKKTQQSKQIEQEQNRRNGDHMEGYQRGSGWRERGEKVQRISSINGR